MADIEDVWQRVTDQIYDEFTLLAEKAGEVSGAISTIVETATTPIDIKLDGYINSTFHSLSGSFPAPFGTTNAQAPGGGWVAGMVGGPPGPLPSGGATGAAANHYVPYVPPQSYQWDVTGSYRHPSFSSAPSSGLDEPSYPAIPEPVPVDEEETVASPEFLALPEFTETTGPVPSPPALRESEPIDRPTGDIPEFTGERPDFQFDTLSIGLDFNDQAYNSALLGALRDASGLWLTGAHPMMRSIWDTLEAAAISRGARMGDRHRSLAREGWKRQGWPVYEHHLDDLDEEAQQMAQNVGSNVGRDAAINKASFFVESWRACIQTGVALEQVFVTEWDKANQRLLEAATALVDYANTVLQLQVKEFSAQTRIYSADASALRAQISAEEEKLSISEAEIKAEKQRGQADADKIAAYEAQQQANEVLVSNYEARQKAWSSVEDQNSAINERFKGLVDALEQEIARYASKWQIFRSQLGMQGNRQEFENILLQAFGQQIQAATTMIGGEKSKNDIALEQLSEKFERAQLSLLKLRADVRNATAELSANVSDRLIQQQRDLAKFGYVRAFNQAEGALPQLALADINEQQQHILQQLQFLSQKNSLAAQQGAIALNTSARSASQIGSAALSTINVQMAAHGSVGSSWNFQNVYVT